MGTAKASAARREVSIELNGNPYTVRELDLRAYADMENFVRSQHIKAYRDSVGGNLTHIVDPEIAEATVMKMVKASYTPEELGEAMGSPVAVEFVAYLALRHNPDVTLENIGSIVDADNISIVNRIIEGMGEDEGVNPPEEKEAEAP